MTTQNSVENPQEVYEPIRFLTAGRHFAVIFNPMAYTFGIAVRRKPFYGICFHIGPLGFHFDL